MLEKANNAGFADAAKVLEEDMSEVLEAYEDRLRALGSPLVESAESRRQLEAQATTVLMDTARILRGLGSLSGTAEDNLSMSIGHMRAINGVHPSESLRAVSALTEAAISVVAERLPSSPSSRREVAGVALAIQESVMERVARASISYVDYLLRKVHEAHYDERFRIGRELHDQVAHSLTVAVQSLELHGTLEPYDAARAQDKLRLAKDTIRDAIGWVKDLSEELRNTTSRDRLEVALVDLLNANVPNGTQTWISVRGDESVIPPYVRDELLLIVRECLRWSPTQQEPKEIRVSIHAAPHKILVIIEHHDRANGSNPETIQAEHTAFHTIRERALLLRGSVEVNRLSEIGTRIEISLPLAQRNKVQASEIANLSRSVSVLIADSHDLFLESLADTLTAADATVEIVGKAATGTETVALAQQLVPNVVMVDLEIPLGGAREVIRKLADILPETRIIVLAMCDDPSFAQELLGLGASAFVAKTATREELISATYAVARGEKVITLSGLKEKAERLSMPIEERLSERQLEILGLVTCKMSNKQIAGALHLSEGTIKRHLANIYKELGVGSRGEAAEKAMVQGLTMSRRFAVWAREN